MNEEIKKEARYLVASLQGQFYGKRATTVTRLLEALEQAEQENVKMKIAIEGHIKVF